MLNDRSSPLALLNSRRSGKPREMHGRGPSEDELEQILTVAARTPDHGKLHPWRFVIVATDQRDALEEVLREALASEMPAATDAHFSKEAEFAHYEGTLVVLVSAPLKDHKIPLWEQELSCGAAGMNLLSAATALGYVAGWVTGRRAYSPLVNAQFCEPGQRIAGFIFIGKSSVELEERPRPELDEVVVRWPGNTQKQGIR